MLDIEKLNNPYIQIVWEDTPNNFTQERIKSVRTYFEKKYKSKNVNVITKIKSQIGETQSIDVSTNILDENFQKELILNYLETNEYSKYKDKIIEIDNTVESKISSEKDDITPFKKWYIKKIEFSNFLSFGDNQVIDFDKIDGITAIESSPPNFGGKSVLSVDLLLFLFFNTTTKTTKAEEIFNRFSDSNNVSVKGEIQIDGDDYIIVRDIQRKLSKKGEWNVSTKLDFFKKLSDGSLENFTGEQRRETETFIKNSIGTMEDFLMTILTTASNLEDLIESKPTARGQVLSRFLGLDSLKLKEESAKEIYSTFSKSMLSNIYNTETLKQEIDNHNNEILVQKDNIETYNKELQQSLNNLKVGQDFRDEWLKKKHTDLDSELLKINPKTLEDEISTYNNKIMDVNSELIKITVIEPSEYYYEDKHDIVREKLSDTKLKVGTLTTKINDIESELKTFDNGVECQYCGIVLAQSEYTEKKKNSVIGLKKDKEESEKLLEQHIEQEKTFVKLKNEFDLYERNKLIKEKYELQVESFQLKKKEVEQKLERYRKDQIKVEENKKIDETLLRADMRLQELQREKDEITLKISTANNRILNLIEKIETNNRNILKIAEEFEKEKIYKIYLEIFGKNGISKMIMRSMMPVINSELQRLLTDSAEFKLEVRISDKDEVEFWMIDNNSQVEKLMVSGSGYERTIASLALRAVLSKVCSLPKPNIVVFDEVFGKISNDNLEMVSEFFHKIKEYFDKILVITHNPLVSQWADSIIKIEKINNISKIK